MLKFEKHILFLLKNVKETKPSITFYFVRA